jgi:1-deoxy-D-xylulose-5-phosphate reductoisomerase
MRTICVLGSTGSIGTQALDVIRRNPERFRVTALAAATSHELLVGQIREFQPPLVAIANEEAATELKARLGPIHGVGIVSGKMLSLANKESLVIGGELIMDLVKGEPDRLVAVDSEHSALAQCLRGERREDLRRVLITASGGPFRGWTRAELERASVKEALAHPTWNMGPKITIDSATLMNKGLEVIEAHYLFGLDYRSIDVVVHPESIIHGMAEFTDGSVVAQMAAPDMRLSIQLALAYPDRLGTGIQPLDLPKIGRLTFEVLDREAFPAVDLAYRAGEMGLTYPAVLNAANEVAVNTFLDGKIRLTHIPEVVEAVLEEHEPAGVVSEVTLSRADSWARTRAAELALSP